MSDICLISASPFDLEINRKEIFRYLNVAKSDSATRMLVEKCIDEICTIATPRAVYVESNVAVAGDEIKFDFMTVKSQNLATNLKLCKRAYAFAATLGIALDREIEKYYRISQLKSSVYHAIGSALIESFCDRVNEILVSNNDSAPRFSPGYGDFSLNYQKTLLTALDAERKIGIILGESLMMSPSKSVTAIIGIK